jgi:DNA-binding LacI/PurR family transcriptional regulator
VTLEDVAAAAGVHASTVSRALSRPDLVNAQTLQRVREAVAHLGYVPNRAARQLAGGRTSTVAMLVPDITNPFFSSVVQAAQRRAHTSGRLVLLADTALDVTTEVDAVRSLAPSVDGLVLCAPIAPTADIVRAAQGRPLVFVNRRARAVPSVVVDPDATVDRAIEHLRALGHTRIAAARGPRGYWSSQQRERALRRHGRGIVLLEPTDPTFAGGQQVLAAVLAAEVTAVAAFNDVMALGLIAAASAAGLTVPAALSVIGADGVPFGAMATPPLTTVGVDLDALGVAAIGELVARIEGDAPGRPDRTIEPAVVVRGSTAPPA